MHHRENYNDCARIIEITFDEEVNGTHRIFVITGWKCMLENNPDLLTRFQYDKYTAMKVIFNSRINNAPLIPRP